MATKDDLLQILLKYDPIGIIFDDNRDEYAPEAESISSRLSENPSQADVKKILIEELQRSFGQRLADKYPDYDQIAAEIHAATYVFTERDTAFTK